MRRWPQLVAQHLSRKQAEGANLETISAFSNKYENFLLKIGIQYATDLSEHLWNCDESGLCNVTSTSKVRARKGSKWVHDTSGGSGRSYTIVLGCGSASGILLPPYIVHKGKNLYASWTKHGAAGALYAVSNIGWMEKENYASWFQKMFIPVASSLTKTGPVVLIFDVHHSHISLDLITTAKEANIHLLLLPSNTTRAAASGCGSTWPSQASLEKNPL